MTIGSPSGSGATQNDIADGVDESDGRWRTLYDDPVMGSADNVVQTGGSGATPSFEDGGVDLGSKSDGDWGFLSVGSQIPGNQPKETSCVLIKVRYGSETAIGSLTADYNIGQIISNQGGDNSNNNAVFRPHVGNNTDGNVRVTNGGTATTQSVTYPTIRDLHNYTVLIDRTGNYLQAGHTGFYIDGDPRLGDSPDADLDAVPQPDFDGVWGIFYESEGNRDSLIGVHLEVTIRP